MTSDQDAKVAARRQFLKLASLGAVAGSVASAVGDGKAAAAEPAPQDKGYRETPHVRKAYELARF